MKNILPIILAAVAFIAVLLILSPTPKVEVVTAARELPFGHTVQSEDIRISSLPKDILPKDALTDPAQIVGLTINVGRSEGDIIRLSHVGEQPMTLSPDERAVAVTVDNASGLAGLLRQGDLVGVIVIVDSSSAGETGTYSKAAVENLRVLYLSPDFQALEPGEDVVTTETDNTTATVAKDRKTQGALVLAVPIESMTIMYDFSEVEPALGQQKRVVNVIEMLTALEASENGRLFLYLMPRDAQEMVTSGLWLPELVIKPYKPTPTISPEIFEQPVEEVLAGE